MAPGDAMHPTPARLGLPRQSEWQLRSRSLHFGRLPALMGIVNVTPDSFSDGGCYLDPQEAVEHGLRLVAEGAVILDVGGESTRPYSTEVDVDEELRRVVPVVRQLVRQVSVPISVDTSKAAVAQAALEEGAEIVNDVRSLAGDQEMLPLVLREQAGVVIMHMQGTPQTMQDAPRYVDVVTEIFDWLAARRGELLADGLQRARLCLDPGVGFGKTHQHNLTLLAHCDQYHRLGCPLLIGHSRKAFIAKVIRDKEAERTSGTIGVALALARQGVQLIRVHDVAPVRQALQLFAAVGGVDGHVLDLDPP